MVASGGGVEPSPSTGAQPGSQRGAWQGCQRGGDRQRLACENGRRAGRDGTGLPHRMASAAPGWSQQGRY